MRKSLVLSAVILALIISAPAFSAEKVITRKQIDRYSGIIHVAMPCNWAFSKPTTLLGEYGDGEGARKPLAHSTAEKSGEWLIVTVGGEDKAGLNLLWIEFQTNQRECGDSFGFKNFTQ